MKKIISLILAVSMLLACIPASAGEQLYTCELIPFGKPLGETGTEHQLRLKFNKISDEIPDDAKFSIVLYTDDGIDVKMDNICFLPVSKAREMQKHNDALTTSIAIKLNTQLYRQDIETTPNTIRVFLWDKTNIRPLCPSVELLEAQNTSQFTEANDYICGLLSKVIAVLNEFLDNGNYKKTDNEKIFVESVVNLAELVLTFKDTDLLTREFAATTLSPQIDTMQTYKNNIEDMEHFTGQMKKIKTSDIQELMAYLGLSHLMPEL